MYKCSLPITLENSGELSYKEVIKIIIVSTTFIFRDISLLEELNCFIGVK